MTRYYTVSHEWERDDESVVTLEINYSVSPIIPASPIRWPSSGL